MDGHDTISRRNSRTHCYELIVVRVQVRFEMEPKGGPRGSGAHRISRKPPDYPDAQPFHAALVAENPERLVWGGDWPHPRMEGEMPDVGRLLDLFQTWTPDAAVQRRILVDNPARLYGFAG